MAFDIPNNDNISNSGNDDSKPTSGESKFLRLPTAQEILQTDHPSVPRWSLERVKRPPPLKHGDHTR